MAWPLVLLMVATAAFSALSVRRAPSRLAGTGRHDLSGLVNTGAAALGLLAVAVAVVVVVADRPDQGAKLAVLSLLCYLVYVGVAAVLIRRR